MFTCVSIAATVTIRTVPNQDVDAAEAALMRRLHDVMSLRGSRNTLRVVVSIVSAQSYGSVSAATPFAPFAR